MLGVTLKNCKWPGDKNIKFIGCQVCRFEYNTILSLISKDISKGVHNKAVMCVHAKRLT